jgi:hypothetical protein
MGMFDEIHCDAALPDDACEAGTCFTALIMSISRVQVSITTKYTYISVCYGFVSHKTNLRGIRLIPRVSHKV